MLVTTKEMFKLAYKEKFAVGAFNVNNMELMQGIVEAGNEENAPLILQISKGARKYADPSFLKKLIEAAIEKYPELPIAMHLDHGEDFEICKSCVDEGYSSVMIDGSSLPYEENIALTKKVVEYAHSKGTVVEGELGKLVGMATDEGGEIRKSAVHTDPDEALEFVEKTGVDSLAISIGTSHGAYKFKDKPQLDFERLAEIAAKLPGFPLVLHGASTVLQEYVKMCNEYGGNIPGAQGVPEEMIFTARQNGVCKVNIDTDLRLAFTAAIRKEFSEHPENFDPRNYVGPARAALKKLVKHKMSEVLGCSGKADALKK